LGIFFENRKNSGLTPGQNDDPVTRTLKMTQMTYWPGDPMTHFHVWPVSKNNSIYHQPYIPGHYRYHQRNNYPHKRQQSLSQEFKGKIILATFFAKYIVKDKHITMKPRNYAVFVFDLDDECEFIIKKTILLLFFIMPHTAHKHANTNSCYTSKIHLKYKKSIQI